MSIIEKLDEFTSRQGIVSAEWCKLLDEVGKLQEQHKIMKEALEFYANGIVQKDDYSEHKSISTFSFTGLNRKNSGYGETEFIEQRFGKRAREALAKVKE